MGVGVVVAGVVVIGVDSTGVDFTGVATTGADSTGTLLSPSESNPCFNSIISYLSFAMSIHAYSPSS